MTTKAQLDEIWNTPGCLCANHLVKWSVVPAGYFKFSELGLFYDKGTRRGATTRRKGKGYTFLPKNYQLWWLHTRRKDNDNDHHERRINDAATGRLATGSDKKDHGRAQA